MTAKSAYRHLERLLPKQIKQAIMRNQAPIERPLYDLTAAEAAKYSERYTFYHCIDLGDGHFTKGWKNILPIQAPTMMQITRRDLSGKRVLDIGCFDGLFSFAAEKQGADYVLGIDNSVTPSATEFLIPYLRSKVQMREVNLYDFTVPCDADKFDLVICAGVIYHLRMPNFGLKRIADAMKPDGKLIIETALMLNYHEHAMVHAPATTESPYEKTSVTFFNHKGLVAALDSLGFIDIQCVNVLIEHDGVNYSSFDEVLTGPHRHLTEPGEKINVARAVYTCRLGTEKTARSEFIRKYWFGTHQLNGRESVYPQD